VVIILSNLWYLTSGIRDLSSSKKKGQFFLYFAGFQTKKKKRATTLRSIPIDFCVEFDENGCRSEFLLEKQPLKKNNNPNWSSRGQDIVVLKSTIFRVFPRMTTQFF
jgi:hypothetical protein